MKISSFWMDVLRGMVIGVANIIPGVSGGTMMVSMGIYDKLIHSVTHLFSDFKKSFRFLLPILIGIVLALSLLAKLFSFLLARWPIATNLGFCGLILGSLPSIFKHVKHKGFKLSYGLCFAAFFVLIVVLAVVNESSGNDVVLHTNFFGLFMLFIVGVIAAATMVIPGVSGSMMLMLMGYYQPVINLVSDGITALLKLDWGMIGHCVILGVPFAIGVVLGIFAIAKLIEWIMNKWHLQTMWAIIGLICASPIAILLKTSWASFSIGQLLIGLVAAAAGWFAAGWLSE
ncbi:MAG: DUF368 domain-containing protein [Allobaculum sp.]|uniref:DUF368 domain-containing protein n=1 Tax=Allobaculum sp. TaxID=1872463 RepID=UPI003999F5E8